MQIHVNVFSTIFRSSSDLDIELTLPNNFLFDEIKFSHGLNSYRLNVSYCPVKIILFKIEARNTFHVCKRVSKT